MGHAKHETLRLEIDENTTSMRIPFSALAARAIVTSIHLTFFSISSIFSDYQHLSSH